MRYIPNTQSSSRPNSVRQNSMPQHSTPYQSTQRSEPVHQSTQRSEPVHQGTPARSGTAPHSIPRQNEQQTNAIHQAFSAQGAVRAGNTQQVPNAKSPSGKPPDRTSDHRPPRSEVHKAPSGNAMPQSSASGRASDKQPYSTARPSPVQNEDRTHNQNSEAKFGFKSISSLIRGILPSSVYNPKTKKIFGVLSSEDLLLIALVFLFAENDGEDSSLLSLALLYILVSEHIDLPDFL